VTASRASAWAAGAGSAMLAAGMAIALPATAAESFHGRWAPDAKACIGESALASPLVVSPFALQWRDAACVVRTSYLVRGAWHIGARCWGEGAISNVPITLRMRGEQLVLDWAGAPAEELRRCP
jgi:hypothetical protein